MRASRTSSQVRAALTVLPRTVLMLILMVLAGCATTLSVPSARVEGVPFHTQTDLQCGPAALASLLQVAGLPTGVPTLSQWMFTPGLGGSLQQDLLGAARRAGALPVRIAGDLSGLQSQLAHGRPVLVLENLALPQWPQWHYAVVTAIDAQTRTVTLGGPDGESQSVSARQFARAWRFADGWAIVVLRPGDSPAGLRPADYLDAVAAFEAIGNLDVAARGYDAGLRQWPAHPDLHFGAGNVALTRGQLDLAASHYQQVLAVQPQDVAALNNLAEVRRRQGDLVEAAQLAQRALQLAVGAPLRDAVEDTLRQISCGAHC